jgi:hypothetical protein
LGGARRVPPDAVERQLEQRDVAEPRSEQAEPVVVASRALPAAVALRVRPDVERQRLAAARPDAAVRQARPDEAAQPARPVGAARPDAVAPLAAQPAGEALPVSKGARRPREEADEEAAEQPVARAHAAVPKNQPEPRLRVAAAA